MTEIKAPLTDRIKLFLSNHLFFIGLVLFCVVLFFSSCGRAKAEGMIQSDRDYIHSIFDSYWGENEWATVENFMDSMPYFIIFKELNGSNYVLYLAPYSTNDYYEARYVNDDSRATGVSSVNIIPWLSNSTDVNSPWSFGIDYGGLIPFSLGNLQWSSSRGQYGYAIFTTGLLGSVHIGYRVDISDRDYSDSGWNRYWYDSVLHGVSNFSASAGRYSMYVDYDWTKTNFNAAVIRGEYTTESHWAQNVFPVSYTEDSRLKFSTSLRGDGEKLLNTDLSDFLSWSPTSGMTVSDLVLTLDCDGTEVEFELDDANSEIIFTKYPSDYSYRCVYLTPYSEFGLDAYEDVSIVKCDFTRTYSHLGPSGSVDDVEDFKISCNYVLKNETAPIEPDVITPPVYDDIEVKTDAQIEVLVEYLNNQSSYSFDGRFTLQSTLDNLPIWADVFSNTLTRMDDDSPYFAGHWYDHNPFVFGDSQIDITEYLLSTVVGAAEYYDVMYFPVYGWYYDAVQGHGDGWSTGLKGYIIFYTQRYFERQSSLTLLDILSVVQNQTQNDIYRTQYIMDRLDDFEDKSLEAFNDLISLDRQRNTWLSTINTCVNTLNQTSLNGFVDVVDAINDIDIPVPIPFDDSNILTVLGTIISKLDNIISNQNNPKDGFNSLIAWVKDDTNTDGLYTWVNAITTGSDNMMKKVFSVFSLDDLDSNTSGIQTYISYSKSFFDDVSGTGQGTYFRRLFDFNININDWNGGV